MINFTRHSLQKIENLFTEIGYIVRYEKGTFSSGYCIVENRNIVIINKFYETEGRIEIMLEILKSIQFEPGILSEKSAKFYKQIQEESVIEDEES